jgi:hypothetical protein
MLDVDAAECTGEIPTSFSKGGGLSLDWCEEYRAALPLYREDRCGRSSGILLRLL